MWTHRSVSQHTRDESTSAQALWDLFSRHSREDERETGGRAGGVGCVVVQWRARDGTIAADTDSYPFGTRMFVPDWGWGVVEDRGGAIQVRENEMRHDVRC
jgi:3D (Asp-Asp-Asp) domain-containing protein